MKRTLRRLLDKPFQTLLFLTVMFLVFLFLSTSFTIYRTANLLRKEIGETHKPIVAVRGHLDVDAGERTEYWEDAFFDSSREMEEYTKNYYHFLKDLSASNHVSYDGIHLYTCEFPLHIYDDEKGFLFNMDSDNWMELLPNHKRSIEMFLNNEWRYLGDYHILSENNIEIADSHFGFGGNLKKGRYFSEEELLNGSPVVVLNGRPTYYNGEEWMEVEAGDKLPLSMFCDGELLDSFEPVSLTVIGILEEPKKLYEGSNDIANVAILPEKLFLSLVEDNYDDLIRKDKDYFYDEQIGAYLGVFEFYPTIFELNTIDNLEPFVQMLEDASDDLLFFYETTADDYVEIYGELNRLHLIFEVLLISLLLISFVSCFFFVNSELKKRMREILILQCLGKSKWSCFVELFLEYGGIALLGLLLQLPLSGMIYRLLITRFIDFNHYFETSSMMIGETLGWFEHLMIFFTVLLFLFIHISIFFLRHKRRDTDVLFTQN